MSDAVTQLTALMDEDDPFAYPDGEVLPVQLEAAAQRLAERRTQVRVLDARARDASIDTVRALDDMVPLLFSHTTYKSYPELFVSEGRWDRMCQWLQTLSALPLHPDDVELSGVVDVDDWVCRLRDAGHFVFSSSGTTGKCSFLDQSRSDVDRSVRLQRLHARWSAGIDAQSDRPVFLLGPKGGTSRWGESFDNYARLFGRPRAVYYLSNRPYSAAETNRLGILRRAIAEGRAMPGDVADHERYIAQREEEIRGGLRDLVDALVAHLGEPLFLAGMWSQFWLVMQELRARGIPDGSFHPDTLARLFGGRKATQGLPSGFEEQICRFLGLDPSRHLRAYGMVEIAHGFPACRAGRFHRPPWIVVLVLDRGGKRLATCREGVVNGRMALVDLTIEGRWGGLVTGDNVTVDHSRCPCGRPGPTVTRVVRYTDLDEDDDKLTCAGTIDAYVRGMIR